MYTSASELTKICQLISNETTKIRILDTPGFFRDSDGGSEASLEEIAQGAAASALATMRDVLRIQAMMQVQIRRIIYFLPVRGPLKRSQKALQLELEQMVYFGKSAFDCMVFVATVTPDVYQYISPDVIPFSDRDYAKTRMNFQSTIRRVLPRDIVLPDDKPPIVFLSMHDTCEDILKKN